MKMAKVRQRAKALGLKSGRTTKEELIRQIQSAEGYRDCFNREPLTCGQLDCAWREDCKSPR